MNSDKLEGKWKQLKGSVKQQWGKLTDDDLTFINGRSEELVGKVQERYGIARDEAQRRVNEFLATNKDMVGATTAPAGTPTRDYESHTRR
jgi:uncharacterized protein YjbJ (UPF0337 family)